MADRNGIEDLRVKEILKERGIKMIKFSDFAVDVNGFVIYIHNIQVSVIRDKKEKDASVKIFDLITNENQTEKYCCYMNHYLLLSGTILFCLSF